MPIGISKTSPALPGWLDAYVSATLRSVVVDMKPNSMPPRTLCALGVQNSSGSSPPAMPRYTGRATVSLPSLTTVELMQCSVVV